MGRQAGGFKAVGTVLLAWIFSVCADVNMRVGMGSVDMTQDLRTGAPAFGLSLVYSYREAGQLAA